MIRTHQLAMMKTEGSEEEDAVFEDGTDEQIQLS